MWKLLPGLTAAAQVDDFSLLSLAPDAISAAICNARCALLTRGIAVTTVTTVKFQRHQ
jgi:hypothetical protein